jgi:hypothetical protein
MASSYSSLPPIAFWKIEGLEVSPRSASSSMRLRRM